MVQWFVDSVMGWFYVIGDLVWLCLDGVVIYLGCLDYQVKIWGLCIELGEIEVVIMVLGFVCECVVLVCEDYGEKWLVVYFVVLDVYCFGLLIEWLVVSLFVYMVFGVEVVLDVLFVIVNGKLDRKVLFVLSFVVFGCVVQIVIEILLVWLFQQVLYLFQFVMVDVDFFVLGGDFLFVVWLVQVFEVEIGCDLGLGMIFEYLLLLLLVVVLDV